MEQTLSQTVADAPAAVMRACVFAGPEQIEVREVARPDPEAGEVRVQLEGCGVCASDLPLWEGRPWFDYPMEPGASGHEAWGRVDAVGSGVEDLTVGDRVAMLSGHAYAEYDTAPAEAVVRLPEELNGKPFPGEPLACALNVVRRSDVQANHTVAVVGIGFLGALLTGLSASAGARVIALSRRRFALDVARQFGADETIQMEGDRSAIVDEVEALTEGAGCDRVIEATGKQEPLAVAAELTRVRGRLVIAGYHQDGPREVNMQLWNWRGLDVINAHERDTSVYVRGMRQAASAAASGRIDPQPLLTHSFSLDQLSQAFRIMQERPKGFMKAVIAY